MVLARVLWPLHHSTQRESTNQKKGKERENRWKCQVGIYDKRNRNSKFRFLWRHTRRLSVTSAWPNLSFISLLLSTIPLPRVCPNSQTHNTFGWYINPRVRGERRERDSHILVIYSYLPLFTLYMGNGDPLRYPTRTLYIKVINFATMLILIIFCPRYGNICLLGDFQVSQDWSVIRTNHQEPPWTYKIKIH